MAQAWALATRAVVLVALLVPGCLSFGRHVEFPPHHQVQTAGESAAFPGLTARATLNGTGDALAIVASVANAGNRTYRVEAGCADPWSDQLFRGDEVLPLHAPEAPCQTRSFAEFPPGLEATSTFTWNGTTWNEEKGRYEPVARGEYVWSVRFVAYAPEGSPGPAFKRFELDFDVTVE